MSAGQQGTRELGESCFGTVSEQLGQVWERPLLMAITLSAFPYQGLRAPESWSIWAARPGSLFRIRVIGPQPWPDWGSRGKTGQKVPMERTNGKPNTLWDRRYMVAEQCSAYDQHSLSSLTQISSRYMIFSLDFRLVKCSFVENMMAFFKRNNKSFLCCYLCCEW